MLIAVLRGKARVSRMEMSMDSYTAHELDIRFEVRVLDASIEMADSDKQLLRLTPMTAQGFEGSVQHWAGEAEAAGLITEEFAERQMLFWGQHFDRLWRGRECAAWESIDGIKKPV